MWPCGSSIDWSDLMPVWGSGSTLWLVIEVKQLDVKESVMERQRLQKPPPTSSIRPAESAQDPRGLHFLWPWNWSILPTVSHFTVSCSKLVLIALITSAQVAVANLPLSSFLKYTFLLYVLINYLKSCSNDNEHPSVSLATGAASQALWPQWRSSGSLTLFFCFLFMFLLRANCERERVRAFSPGRRII